ncbi:MAG: hypothetical protein RID05_00655 [Cytophagales bacterium]
MLAIVLACNNKYQDKETVTIPENNSVGKWLRIGQTDPIAITIKENGLIETDFGHNQTIDVVTKYELSGDTIKFIDKDGKMCQNAGLYKMYQTKYYLAFDQISDDCAGRIKSRNLWGPLL